MHNPGLPWWLGGKEFCLLMQETRVWSLVWEDPMCLAASELTSQLLSLNAATPEVCEPKGKQEKPLQREACTLQLKSSPHSPQLEENLAAMKTEHSQK